MCPLNRPAIHIVKRVNSQRPKKQARKKENNEKDRPTNTI